MMNKNNATKMAPTAPRARNATNARKTEKNGNRTSEKDEIPNTVNKDDNAKKQKKTYNDTTITELQQAVEILTRYGDDRKAVEKKLPGIKRCYSNISDEEFPSLVECLIEGYGDAIERKKAEEWIPAANTVKHKHSNQPREPSRKMEVEVTSDNNDEDPQEITDDEMEIEETPNEDAKSYNSNKTNKTEEPTRKKRQPQYQHNNQ